MITISKNTRIYKRMRNDRKKTIRSGFTLAEVLLTLIIIGVVGALTIPGFIAEHQKITYITGFKKFFSSFNNNMNSYLASQGCVGDLLCSGALGNASMTTAEKEAEFEKIIPEIFPGAQKCNPQTLCRPNRYKVITNDGSIDWNTFPMLYRLQDGMIISAFVNNAIFADCSSANNLCGRIFIDINGKKGPNIAGRDVFGLSLNKKGNLVPVPQYSSTALKSDCDPQKATFYQFNGSACGTRILRENWEMNY